MKTKTTKRHSSGGATGNGGRKRGGVKPRVATPPYAVHAASTSAHRNTSSLECASVSRTAKRAKARAPDGRTAKLWQLRLYVAGQTPKSLTAFSNLKKICESHLNGRYRIEVIDLMEQPQLSKGDQILAIPTLVRKLPQPVRKIIGDLSDANRVLVGLDLRPADSAS